MRSKIRVLIAVRAFVLCVGLVGGCAPPQVEPPTSATDSGDSSTSAGNSTGAPTSGGQATEATTDATDSASGDPGGTTDSAACEGPNGCFDCPPSKPLEVLNACTDATCEPFPNTKKRLPLLKDDGTLPPLP